MQLTSMDEHFKAQRRNLILCSFLIIFIQYTKADLTSVNLGLVKVERLGESEQVFNFIVIANIWFLLRFFQYFYVHEFFRVRELFLRIQFCQFLKAGFLLDENSFKDERLLRFQLKNVVGQGLSSSFFDNHLVQFNYLRETREPIDGAIYADVFNSDSEESVLVRFTSSGLDKANQNLNVFLKLVFYTPVVSDYVFPVFLFLYSLPLPFM